MILMKEYVSMTTTAVAVKMGKIDFYSLLRGKNASLGNSILNHSGHITKILIDFFEIFTSERYHRNMKINISF